MARDDVEALLHPRNIVMVGASDRDRHWSERVYNNLKRFDYPGGIYPINPKREEIWGIPCFPGFDALPEPPDHIICFVPADIALNVLEDGAAHGARSALIFAGDFGEGGNEKGRERAKRLAAIIDKTGLAVCGPNCMGNAPAPSRAITLPDDGMETLESGPTAIIAQSGGLCLALNRMLTERGLNPSYIVSAGNQVGLGAGDYIRFMARQPQIKGIMLYLEQVVRVDDFIKACGEASDAGKAVVAVKIGGSDEGRAAALAHTGSLAGSVDAFDALAGAAGVVRLDCLEDAVEAMEYLARTKAPMGTGVGAITNSGAMKSLISESAARAGVTFATPDAKTQETIAAVLGPLASASNPLDTRQTITTDKYIACIEAFAADPNFDLLLVAEDLPLAPGIERKELNLAAISEWTKGEDATLPVALFAPANVALTDHAQALRKTFSHLAYLSDPDRAFRVFGRIFDQIGRRTRAQTEPKNSSPLTGKQKSRIAELKTLAGDKPTALDETTSKAVLADFGLTLAREAFATDGPSAAKAAQDIGFPVVIKAVSADLPHKTEAGAIMLGLKDADGVKTACDTIATNVARYDGAVKIDGFLVAEQVQGGIELALGISKDPEMGPVVVFGSGGILVELYKDVALGRAGLNRAEAEAMIDATRAGKLLDGYRGAAPADRDAVVDAILRMGRFAEETKGLIEAVDINPLLARPKGQGCVALDALVVLAPKL
ncbi:MAG: acetate--CoA ligase family protein [Alphaproteobacteria bacterium]|jgi:acyl-CoA synthetase (NDP forming)